MARDNLISAIFDHVTESKNPATKRDAETPARIVSTNITFQSWDHMLDLA